MQVSDWPLGVWIPCRDPRYHAVLTTSEFLPSEGFPLAGHLYRGEKLVGLHVWRADGRFQAVTQEEIGYDLVRSVEAHPWTYTRQIGLFCDPYGYTLAMLACAAAALLIP